MKHIRIATYEFKPEKIAESLGRAERELLPLFRSQRGFVSYAVYLTDPGNVASLSVWADQEAAENAAKLAGDWVKRNLADAVIAQKVTIGKLAFDESEPLAAGTEATAPMH